MSSDDKAHGVHGKGDGREERTDDVVVEPATKEAAQQRDARAPASPDDLARKLEGHMGDASWGDAGSGGSTVDKRSPKK